MTIKLEQEAIVRVLDMAGSSLPCHIHHPLKPPSTGGLRRRDAEPPSKAPYDAVELKSPENYFCPDLQSLDSDEDCMSLSSYGSVSSFNAEVPERRVSFAAPLVTEVKTRPRTEDSDKGLLFYTQSEPGSFRQIYREERQSQSTDSVQNVNLSDPSDEEPPSSEGYGRRRISRVVVEHEDCLKTFYDFDDFPSYPQDGGASVNDVFFDNDSFWSGSITWY